MAATVKVIDISRTYVPIDPNSFPESMHSTGAEDAPEERVPSVPYDGYNFMPTAYGYMSYFGINSTLDIAPILDPVDGVTPVKIDDLFLVQTLTFQNFLVALTERGIFTKYAGAPGLWLHVVDLPAPPAGKHLNWTKCVIENAVYCYRSTGDSYWVLNEANDFVPEARIPTHLNMAGQHGIFKAGGRLGFWDSENSTAWSDADDTNDFVPDLRTGAGAAIFQQVIGRIVNVIQHSNGFVIYATRSITIVQRGTDAFMFWIATSAFNDNGISYLQEATMGQPDTTHYAYTTFGLVKIDHGKAEYIIPEVFTYLKESRLPVYLKLLEGRYLFFQVLDGKYITPNIEFTNVVVPSSILSWPNADKAIDDANLGISVCKGMRSAENNQEGAFLFATYGYTGKQQATVAGQVPIWEDHISSVIDMDIIKAWIEYTPGYATGDKRFILNGVWDKAGIPRLVGGLEYMLPADSPPLIAGFVAKDHVEDNEQNFYMKQDFAWMYEDYYVNRDWKAAVREKVHPDIVQTTNGVVMANKAFSEEAEQVYTYGPYVDPGFFSESNKYQGVSPNTKTAWEQRSLTKGILVKFRVKTVTEYYNVTPVSSNFWGTGLNPIPTNLPYPFETYTVNFATTQPHSITGFAGFYPGGSTGLPPVGNSTGYVMGVNPLIGAYNFFFPANFGYAKIKDPTEPVMYTGTLRVTQHFLEPEFSSVDIETCIVKEIGYTKIKGHGHYQLGVFVVDDMIPEPPDYSDICDTNPKKKKQPAFNGFAVPSSPSFVCGARSDSVMINGSKFTFPAQYIVLPPTNFLLQDGSIEPLYPTYPGAFVYDLQYKKWGKMAQEHKVLLNYSPLNTHSGDQIVPADIFNVNAGCLLGDGKIALFDKYPWDSIIKIGKIGYFRKGFTDCEELIIQFRDPAKGAVSIEGSLDGKTLDPSLSRIAYFDNVREFRTGFTASARWWNVCISGIYDIKNVDFNGNKKGKR